MSEMHLPPSFLNALMTTPPPMDKPTDMTYFSHSGDNYDISQRSVYLSEQKDDQSASFFSTQQRLLSRTKPLNGSITERLFVFFCAVDATCLYVQG